MSEISLATLRDPRWTGTQGGLECADPICDVCGNYLRDHWRGRPCMAAAVRAANEDPDHV